MESRRRDRFGKRPRDVRDRRDPDPREIAASELRAAVLLVAEHPAYRVWVSGARTDPGLVAALDGLAAELGVVLERRIRMGGGLDVMVRAA